MSLTLVMDLSVHIFSGVYSLPASASSGVYPSASKCPISSVTGVAVGLLALTVFVLAGTGASTVRAGISRSSWALTLHILTAIFAVGAFYTLWTRRYQIARVCAATQVTLILLGWAFAQFPYLIEPNMSITSAAAPKITLQLLLGALVAGALLLFPSYYYLFRIFKTQ
jgi:cytochrome bd ubiquinol oxidase subunit II